MICAMFVCMLFCLGGIALAIGAGVITFTFGMIGGIAKGICKLIGVLLMPIALMFCGVMLIVIAAAMQSFSM